MAKSAEKCPECGTKREDDHAAFCVVGMVDEVAAERDELRKSLSALSGAAYDVVRRYSSLEMSGRKYQSDVVRKLAEAMYAANKHFHDPAQHKSDPHGG